MTRRSTDLPPPPLNPPPPLPHAQVTEYIGDQYARGWGEAVDGTKGCDARRTLGGRHPQACDGFYETFTQAHSRTVRAALGRLSALSISL